MSKFSKESGITVHVTEGVLGTWHYHLSTTGTNATALCGARTMHTSVPLSAWGFKGELRERYCSECAGKAQDELISVGVAPALLSEKEET